MNLTELIQNEWLEADGLGGFASGTVSGVRTRRYHALLLTSTKAPAGRLVLVNGFDASRGHCGNSRIAQRELSAPSLDRVVLNTEAAQDNLHLVTLH